MSENLKKRIATALIGVVVLILVIVYGGRPGVALISLVVSLGMLNEYLGFILELGDKIEKKWIMLALTWLVSFSHFWMAHAVYGLWISSILGLAIYFLAAVERLGVQEFQNHFKEFVFCVFGLFYLVFIPLELLEIRDSQNGLQWVGLFFALLWAGDIGAYFAGQKYGKRKLYPKVSPAKTLEGLLGGILTGCVVAILYKFLFFRFMSWIAVIVIPLLIIFFGMLGDLFESFFKRAFAVKDSGSFLPGHGGFLDRFDSFIFSLPVMYACVKIFS